MRVNGHHIVPTPMERKAGRIMRAPDHPDDSGAMPDNQPGNPDPGSGSDPSQNNDGQDDRINSFWNPPSESSESSDSSGDSASDPGAELGQSLARQIQEASFGEAFTREIGEQLADGNMEGANERFTEMFRQNLQQSVQMSARIVEAFGQQMESRVEQMIQERLGNQENSQALESEFEGMRDPAMAPMIRGVFNQALKHANGDRDTAISMTRDMLKAMGKRGAKDMGLDTPPSNPDDNFGGTNSTSLVEELLGARRN